MLTHTPPHLLSARCPNRNEQGITLQTLIITAVLVLLALIGSLLILQLLDSAPSDQDLFVFECGEGEWLDPLIVSRNHHTQTRREIWERNAETATAIHKETGERNDDLASAYWRRLVDGLPEIQSPCVPKVLFWTNGCENSSVGLCHSAQTEFHYDEEVGS